MKKLAIIFCITVVTVVTFSEFSGKETPKSKQLTYSNQGKNDLVTPNEPMSSKNDASKSAQASAVIFVPESKEYYEDWCRPEELTIEGLSTAIKEEREFYASHGIFDRGIESPSVIEMYETYDIQSLRALGRNGDFVALASLYYHPDSSEEIKQWASNISFIYGATSLVKPVSSGVYSRAISKSIRSGGTLDVKNEIIEAMALAEFAAMRSSLRAMNFINMRIIANAQSGRGVSLREADLTKVRARAKQIYNDFNEERAERNLQPFNIVIPKVVQQDNEYFVAKASVRGQITNWMKPYFPGTECTDRIMRAGL